MNRHEFHLKFGSKKPIILPVIHVLDHEQTYRNIVVAIEGGCPGVFLINHDFDKEYLLPIIKSIRVEFPDYWIGINFLAVTGEFAFPILGALQSQGIRVDGYWADDACIDERLEKNNQIDAKRIDAVRKASGWHGLYIGGVAFKKQREIGPADYAYSALLAGNHMDIVVTSGIATGHAADVGKIKTFRASCGDTALAVASGITPDNAYQYINDVDLFMVATGINLDGDFYNIDANKLKSLIDSIEH
jgi:predicted TIM-barrel enzyme